jgi:hypothetical protein
MTSSVAIRPVVRSDIPSRNPLFEGLANSIVSRSRSCFESLSGNGGNRPGLTGLLRALRPVRIRPHICTVATSRWAQQVMSFEPKLILRC